MLNIIKQYGNDRNSTSSNPNSNSNSKKSFKNMIIDSVIIGGITLFSTWNGTPDIANLLVAGKGFLLAFCVQLGFERGIKRMVK